MAVYIRNEASVSIKLPAVCCFSGLVRQAVLASTVENFAASIGGMDGSNKSRVGP